MYVYVLYSYYIQWNKQIYLHNNPLWTSSIILRMFLMGAHPLCYINNENFNKKKNCKSV